MPFLRWLTLAALALGLQLPSGFSLPLCLCRIAPVACASAGSCGRPADAPASCCAGRLEQGEREGGASAEQTDSGCCGCRLELASNGEPAALAAQGRALLPPAPALLPPAATELAIGCLTLAPGTSAHDPPRPRVNLPLLI